MLVTWKKPVYNDEVSVTGYQVLIADNNGKFRDELTNCDMRFELSCSLPKLVLMSDPFNLKLGDEVLAKIIAITNIGLSDQSEQGSGATLVS